MAIMKSVITALLVLRMIPFINTQCVACATACGSRLRRDIWLRTAFINVLCNGLTLLCADYICFGSGHGSFGIRALLRLYRDMLTLNCAYQDIGALAAASAACVALSFAYGFALRIAAQKSRGSIASRKGTLLSVLMVSLWLPFAILGFDIGFHGSDHVAFSAFCRKADSGMPEGSVPLSESAGGDDDQSYVSLYNDGAMACRFTAWLSNVKNPSDCVDIGQIVIPAHGTYTCAMRCGRELRLDDAGETTLILEDEAGNQIDRVSVPPLQDGEVYRRDAAGGGWKTYRYAGKGDKGGQWTPVIPAPVFSAESGFYEDAFDLVLQGAEGCRVFYTLDGSAPSAKSLEYTRPIRIEDASRNENVYSMRTDISTGFYEERIYEVASSSPPGYSAPDFLIDKCTIVRAACLDAEGNRSEIQSRAFFVGFDKKDGYEGVNIVSIIMNPRDLFDYEKGIYVTGRDYDDYVAAIDSGETDRKGAYWWWWNANYRRKGAKSEKLAWMELYDCERRLSLSKKIGVRIQGGGSRGYLPRSFNLYARQKYDGSSSFPISLGKAGFSPQRMTLFAGGDARVTKLEDYLMSELVSDRAVATMAFMPCALFLNGEYWGNYWLTEKFDEEYLAYYYKVDRSDVVMIKNSKVAEGGKQDRSLYTDMKDFISQSDMTVEENYDRARAMIDIDSFIDYYAVQAYIGRHNDWPRGNFALWRTRSSDGGGYSDGRWRWMLFDDNSGAFVSAYITEDTLTRLREADDMFASLMRREDLALRFVETLRELAVNNFNPRRVRDFIDDYKSLMSEPLRKEYARFYGGGNAVYEDAFLPRINEIEAFLLGRYDYIIEYCDAYLSQHS